MTVSVDTGEIAVFRSRRNVELVLILLACSLGISGYAMTHVTLDGSLPENLIPISALWIGLGILANFAMRKKAPYADPVFLPIVFAPMPPVRGFLSGPGNASDGEQVSATQV